MKPSFRPLHRKQPNLISYVLLTVCAIAVIGIEITGFRLPDDRLLRKDIDLFGVFTGLAFFLTFLELVRKRGVEQTDIVSEHFASFLTDATLCGAFYSLIYNFGPSEFRKVEDALKAEGLDISLKGNVVDIEEADRERHWTALQNLNNGRAIGDRFFHPKFFQGSPEEQRLDTLLNFFDVFAHGYLTGVFDLSDFNGVAAYYLTIIQSREVFQCYTALIDAGWPQLNHPQSPILSKTVSAKPYYNLRALIEYVQFPNKTGKKDPRNVSA